MRWLFLLVGLVFAMGAAALPGLSLAESDLADLSWTVVVAEQCQFGQIGRILLQAGGIARVMAQVETSVGGNSVSVDSHSTDLAGRWSYSDNALHLSFNDGSPKLDGPVKNGKFTTKAVVKTDLGDPLQ